ELKPNRLITVFGCGGDRDKSKRPGMGRVSSELSDRIFITSDNPRSEEPLEIIKGIIKGIPVLKKNYIIEKDRARAIELALKDAKSKDIVLVAGKGHETYQIFKDITIPFDDREVIKKFLTES
ncbi:MAG: UDP-N-acetylmuramoyl-L-alanyl-D-glutamate--2,6-diaminopimelate ligase, partial [Candidatus Omnitrophica bacterium]|nr:UDP-N-acetylmuramoyl-L-alanyl-D-glutamate--2,6-diaminopimelate ligase [Candidatus Omnitrophota bacterium]